MRGILEQEMCTSAVKPHGFDICSKRLYVSGLCYSMPTEMVSLQIGRLSLGIIVVSASARSFFFFFLSDGPDRWP